MIKLKNALGQIIECQLVGNIYDKDRDLDIKKETEKVEMKKED